MIFKNEEIARRFESYRNIKSDEIRTKFVSYVGRGFSDVLVRDELIQDGQVIAYLDRINDFDEIVEIVIY